MLINLLIFLFVGAVAGFLAGEIVRGEGFGLLVNILIGIVGAVIGGFLLGLFDVALGGILGQIVTATLGAVVLLVLANALNR